jgi:hypothetical protein
MQSSIARAFAVAAASAVAAPAVVTSIVIANQAHDRLSDNDDYPMSLLSRHHRPTSTTSFWLTKGSTGRWVLDAMTYRKKRCVKISVIQGGIQLSIALSPNRPKAGSSMQSASEQTSPEIDQARSIRARPRLQTRPGHLLGLEVISN